MSKTPESRLKGMMSEKDARALNETSGEIWIFEHRGMSIWYNGIDPMTSWSIQEGGFNSYEEDNNPNPIEHDILWSSLFTRGDHLQEIPGIIIGGKSTPGILLKEIVIRGYRQIDDDYPYLDPNIDVGKKGWVETDKGKFEAELVEVWWIGDEDLDRYEWIDEITGLTCIKPYWDRRINEEGGAK
jgi:hypothetical protein